MISNTETEFACVEHSALYLDPLLEDPGSATTTMQHRREEALRQQAGQMCAACPALQECLFNAVTKFDVTGFVAGTTAAERRQIRKLLGIEVNPDCMDIFAGVHSGQKFDADEIYRLRQAYPDEPLKTIAERAGCSLSTVKRHLRRLTCEGGAAVAEPAVTVTPAQVTEAAHLVKYGHAHQAA